MIWVRPIQTHCVEVFWMPVSPSRPSLGLRGGHEGPWTKIFIFVTVKNFQWMCVPIFFSVHYWPKSVPFVHFKQNQSRGFWEKFTFLYTQFWPKTALFWPRGADFDPKTQKYSETSCYNPKPCIPGQNLVSERLCHFWGLQVFDSDKYISLLDVKPWLSWWCTDKGYFEMQQKKRFVMCHFTSCYVLLSKICGFDSPWVEILYWLDW